MPRYRSTGQAPPGAVRPSTPSSSSSASCSSPSRCRHIDHGHFNDTYDSSDGSDHESAYQSLSRREQGQRREANRPTRWRIVTRTGSSSSRDWGRAGTTLLTSSSGATVAAELWYTVQGSSERQPRIIYAWNDQDPSVTYPTLPTDDAMAHVAYMPFSENQPSWRWQPQFAMADVSTSQEGKARFWAMVTWWNETFG